MTSQNPDPEEGNITGLEPGGGVPPGETPPAEGSMGAPQGHEEKGPKKGSSIVWMVVVAVFVLLFLLYFVGYIIGVIGQ